MVLPVFPSAGFDFGVAGRATRRHDGRVVLPAVPERVQRLAALQSQAESAERHAAALEIIADDAALSLWVLRTAAATRAPAVVVFTLDEAVAALGLLRIVRIAGVQALSETFCKDGPAAVVRDIAWRRATTAALLAASLVAVDANARQVAEMAFMGALWRALPELCAIDAAEAQALLDPDGIFGDESDPDDAGAPAIDWGFRGNAIAFDDLYDRLDGLLALFERRSDFSLEDVVAAGDLGVDEAAAVLRLLPSLPARIAAWAVERRHPQPSSSVLSTLPTSARRVLAETTSGSSRVYSVRALSRRSLVLRGRQALATGQLIALRLDFAVPIDIWALVTAVHEAAEGRVDVVVAPWCLSGEAAIHWRSSARQASRAAAASRI